MSTFSDSRPDPRATLPNPDFAEAPPLEPPAPPPLPRALGRYRVIGLLGHGTTGVVYEAHDPSLDRRVALKLLHPTRGPQYAVRSRNEALALARLSDPNVVGIYETGTIDGRAFIAMELVEGQSLRQWQSPSRSWRAVLEVYRGAGRGLAAIHRAGLVHRDFKPDNCLIDAAGRVRVVDFGLAADSAPSSPHRGHDPVHPERGGMGSPPEAPPQKRLTRRGAVVGTLAYMPPMQRQGAAWDAHADQYSFCASMVETLLGQHSASPAVVSMPSEPIDSGSVIRRGIPRALLRVLRRGLEADPKKRWTSMEALLGALERCQSAPARRWCAVALVLTNIATAAVTSALVGG
ncbi:MAG: serine/threonine-protein kinase [Myxococcota bacterium]